MYPNKIDAGDAASSRMIMPAWALSRPKPPVQLLWDLVGAPLRMMILSDRTAESMHLTSLRAERFAIVLPLLRGRVLDIGAGDNKLIKLYHERITDKTCNNNDAFNSVGVDNTDWGADCIIIENSASLPFPDRSFDTVCFIACLNCITNRNETLSEANRVLRPGGRIVITMIGPWIGTIGHAIWWRRKDKRRDAHQKPDFGPGEKTGMGAAEVMVLLEEAHFSLERMEGFCYGLNKLFVATRI